MQFIVFYSREIRFIVFLRDIRVLKAMMVSNANILKPLLSNFPKVQCECQNLVYLILHSYLEHI